jgi:rhodanese-related sulfurtransferase
MAPSSDESTELEAERVAEVVAEGWQVIDVREPHEWDAGRIAGTRHVPIAQLTAEAESFDRERPIVFYCRVGSRSGLATDAFRASGFEAYHLRGGIVEWVQRGLPLEPADGRVADD